jgi:nucleotide-binding universal stress UspA family protein
MIMKKILVLLNAGYIPHHVITNAINIAGKTSSSIYAVILNDLNTDVEFDYPFPNDLTLTGTRISKAEADSENRKRIESELQIFRDECELAGIEYYFEIDQNVSLKHLIELSKYSDFILVDAKSDSDAYSLKNVLIDAHCPVLLMSREAEPVARAVLLYDGSSSSIYAIKMFSYLFPEWSNLPTTIVYVSPSEDEENLPQQDDFQSWLSKHFTNVQIAVLHGKKPEQIFNFISTDTSHTIAVMGAYGENAIHRIFHKSLAESVLNNTHASIFIAHE